MSVGRKAIGWAAAGILLAGTAGVGYAALRPKNDPRVIGALPKGLHLMPRSQFYQKPWFDLPWFGGKRLTYPTNTKMPKGFKDDPEISGIVTWDPPTPMPGAAPLPPTAMSSMISLMPVYFGIATWKDESGAEWELKTVGEFYGSYSWTEEYAVLPYVYGDRAKRFQVTWFDLAAAGWLRPGDRPPTASATIELPPNHQRAPKVTGRDIRAGNWTLHIEASPQIGPSFARSFNLSVLEAKPGDVFFLDTELSNPTPFGTLGLRIEFGKKTRLYLPAKPQDMRLFLTKVEEKKRDFWVKGMTGRSTDYRTFDCVDANKRKIALGYQVSGIIYFQPVPDSALLECSLAGEKSRTGRTFGVNSMATLSRGVDSSRHNPLKEGDVMHCVVTRKVATAVAKLKL